MELRQAMAVLGKLAKLGIEVCVVSENCFTVGGFYKSGTVEVDIKYDQITARYQEINDFSDDLEYMLTRVNYEWWQKSKNRYEGWENPSEQWVPLLIEHGFITKTEKVITEYTSA
jgi:hypothetical protein